MAREIAFPMEIDGSGRVAGAGEDAHIRQLIEQLLFTSPGERVNRPEFGTGLMQMVFAPNSEDLQTAVAFTVQGALQRWLGDRIQVESVSVSGEDSTLGVVVQYIVRRTQERRRTSFEREV